MKNKKKMLARLIYVSGAIRLCRRVLSGRLVVFNYHRIRTDEPLLETPFDSDVFGPSQSEFRREMEWLKRNTRVISETDLLDHLRGERALNGLNVMITFDDGYIDNYTLAYPVLKELEIPAVFFIPTDLIQARRLGWWDIAAYLVKNTSRAEISHFGNTFDLRKEKIGTIRYFHSILRRMKPELGRELIYELAEYCNVPFPDVQEQGAQLMDWDQIRTVSKNGIGIGSHTHSHPTLSTLNPDDQRKEMVCSASILKEQTGERVRSIAYPLGGHDHITSGTARIAAEAGYEAGFTFNTGMNLLQKMSRYDLRRISGPDDIYLLFSSTLFPSLFSWNEHVQERHTCISP